MRDLAAQTERKRPGPIPEDLVLWESATTDPLLEWAGPRYGRAGDGPGPSTAVIRALQGCSTVT